MGKNLRQQRRGRATPRYRSHVNRQRASYNDVPSDAKVADVVHVPGRAAPLAVVAGAGGKAYFLPADGMTTGDAVAFGIPEAGNIMYLKDVPEGTKVFNVELNPGDGGRLCRSAGGAATVVTAGEKRSVIMMPSRQKKTLSGMCRATVGTAAGSGRGEKPFMRAGAKHYAMLRKGRIFPRTSGVSMNAVDHPFGGQTRPGKHKSVSRHAPPGRKVGNISPRRTGKKKRK